MVTATPHRTQRREAFYSVSNGLRFIFFMTVGWVAVAAVARERLYHDVSSYLAPVVLHQAGVATPYADLFDIKPPGVLLILDIWVSIFGASVVSIAALDGLAIAAILWLLDSITKCVSTWPLRLSAVSVVGAAYVVGAFKSMLVQTETLGVVLILLSVLLLSRTRHTTTSAFFVGVCVCLATQIKDIFLPALVGFAILVLLSVPKKPRIQVHYVAAYVGGAATVFLGVVVYLHSLGSLAAYVEVLEYKLETFSLPILPIVFLALLGTFLVARRRDLPPLFNRVCRVNYIMWLAAIPFLSVVAGTIWQGRLPLSHYGEPVFITFVLMMTCVGARVVAHRRTLVRRVATALIVLAMAAPIFLDLFVRGVPPRFAEPARVLDALSVESPDAIYRYQVVAEHASANDCVLQPYGWDAGATYLYSRRIPCSKFFLPNLMTPTQKGEYVRELLLDPPSVVVYSRVGADLNVDQFERDVFDWSNVLKECYAPLKVDGDATVFIQQSEAPLQLCVEEYH